MLQSKEQIGRRDRRIIIQVKTIGVNNSNEDEETGWEEFATVWARVDEKSGGEYYRDDKLTAVTVADFNIRYMTGILEDMRIVFNGRYYGIKSILYPDRQRSVVITAQSGGEYVEILPGFTLGFSLGFNS
jgi:SPP1 family predicted phage head-tail adaptor